MATLRAREVLTDSKYKIVAIESIDFQSKKTNTHSRMFGYLKPIAIIVYSPDSLYAIDMEAQPVALEQLRQDVPELETMITSFNKS